MLFLVYFAKAYENTIPFLGTYILQKFPFTMIGKFIILVKEDFSVIKIFIHKFTATD